MILRWLAGWFKKNDPEGAKVFAGEIVRPEPKKLGGFFARMFKKEKSPHVQTPLIVPKRTVKHDNPAGQRGGNRAK